MCERKERTRAMLILASAITLGKTKDEYEVIKRAKYFEEEIEGDRGWF